MGDGGGGGTVNKIILRTGKLEVGLEGGAGDVPNGGGSIGFIRGRNGRGGQFNPGTNDRLDNHGGGWLWLFITWDRIQLQNKNKLVKKI